MDCESSEYYVGKFWILVNNRTRNIFKNMSCKYDNILSNTAIISDVDCICANEQNEQLSSIVLHEMKSTTENYTEPHNGGLALITKLNTMTLCIFVSIVCPTVFL